MTTSMNQFDFTTFDDFSSAGQAILSHLRGHLGFALWVITRVDGDDWIVLQTLDNGLGVARGDVVRFSETLCSRMVRGLGPNIATRVADTPAYVTADQASSLGVAAYIGVPILLDDGTLFGTLAGFDTSAHPADLSMELPLVKLFARLLATELSHELREEDTKRKSERAELENDADTLTGVGSRDLWDRMLPHEEERCARYGHAACVISVDLDDLDAIRSTEGFERGDELLVKAATAIRNSCRTNDIVARVGEDDFAILAVECDTLSGARLIRRLERAFVDRGVKATLGLAGRDPSQGLEPAWHDAMRLVIERKRRRETRRGA